jgi:hypothetical protein
MENERENAILVLGLFPPEMTSDDAAVLDSSRQEDIHKSMHK